MQQSRLAPSSAIGAIAKLHDTAVEHHSSESLDHYHATADIDGSVYMQVQAAIAEASAATRSSGPIENGHASSSARDSTPRASAGSPSPLAEGTETALLYVRFRAAAEPGLKGAHFSQQPAVFLASHFIT